MDERHRQSVTISAKTVDDAIAEAERELGVPRDRLDITVITEGSKGFLGMRAENARILAIVMGGVTAPAEPASRAGRGVAVEALPGAHSTAPLQEQEPAPPTPLPDEDDEDDELAEGFDLADYGDADVAAQGLAAPVGAASEPGKRAQQRQETATEAQEVLDTLLRHMDIRARVSVRSASDPIILDVETDNGGLLIGRRGETLSALQYLVNVLIGKRTRGWTKVVIDVEHWRARREDTLRALALRQADRVRQQRRPLALDPMPANERRIIHLTLQEQRDIETHSEGEEPNRRLVISLKR